MNIYPYGENGITNSLMEVFDANPILFTRCLTKLTKWISTKPKKFVSKGNNLIVNWVIQQAGFGRQGFGEPDSVVMANNKYVFYFETKATSYRSSFKSKSGDENFEKLGKYFAIGYALKNMLGTEKTLVEPVIRSSKNKKILYTNPCNRSFGIHDRPKIIQNKYMEIKGKRLYYFILMTKDKSDSWGNIKQHYKENILKYLRPIRRTDKPDNRFGWLPLIEIYNIVKEEYDKENGKEYLKLIRAFECNGF